MHSLEEVLAWKVVAPWSTPEQVEQDLLITKAICAIFSHPFLREQVAMRGGTMLHKLHLAPASRYSEDIDLVAVGTATERQIRKALIDVLTPVMGKAPTSALWAQITLAVRNAARKSKVLRLEWVYMPMTRAHSMTLKVEVNVTERTPMNPVVTLPFAGLVATAPTVDVVTYDINEELPPGVRARW